jgi:hypothetical protein
MIDLDGSYTYSSVQLVRLSVVSSVSVFPNPTSNYVNITLAAPVASATKVQLLSLSGQLLQEQQIEAGANGTITLAVQSYKAGMYIVRVADNNGGQQTMKLMIQH